MLATAEGDGQAKQMLHDELILFYRVKDLEQFDFEEEEQSKIQGEKVTAVGNDTDANMTSEAVAKDQGLAPAGENQETHQNVAEPQVSASTALQENDSPMDAERPERPFGAASSHEVPAAPDQPPRA